MMSIIIVMTPVILLLFSMKASDRRIRLSEALREIHEKRYYLHALGYLIIIKWKDMTDLLNEPIKHRTGHWTEWIYAIEGDFTKWIQDAFYNELLTEVLNFHYLFIYLFLIYVTTVFYAYVGERDLTDKVALNYLLIYALAVPYYLFFNVEVTSSWIPGMEALLYHDGWYTPFYVSHDPLDNAVPSLHVAIPFGILMINWLHCREKNIKMKDWDFYHYHLFILANTILFCFAILYLGIHWFVDIPLGMLVGGVGALFIHHLQPRLRNDHGGWFEGVDFPKVRKHLVIEGAIALILGAAIMGAVAYQESIAEEQVSFRLGPEDSTFEIVQELKYDEPMTMEVTNLAEHDLEVVLLLVEATVPAMDDGFIDWEKMKELGDMVTIPAESTRVFSVSQPMVYHVLVMHNPDSEDIQEVRIINDYGKDVMWRAIVMSIASLWMTGFVVHRLIRLKMAGRSLIDSTPSHLWEEE